MNSDRISWFLAHKFVASHVHGLYSVWSYVKSLGFRDIHDIFDCQHSLNTKEEIVLKTCKRKNDQEFSTPALYTPIFWFLFMVVGEVFQSKLHTS